MIIMTSDDVEQFRLAELALAGNGVGTPRQLLNCVAGHRQMKWAPFPNAVARVCGVPLQEQPRC